MPFFLAVKKNTGQAAEVFLHPQCAQVFGLRSGDWLKIQQKQMVVIAPLVINEKKVGPEEIGITQHKKFAGLNNQPAAVTLQSRRPLGEIVRKKLSGQKINSEDYQTLVQAASLRDWTAAEKIAWNAAIFARGLSASEAREYAQALLASRRRRLTVSNKFIDIQIIGGPLGYPAQLVALPIVASCRLKVCSILANTPTLPDGPVSILATLTGMEFSAAQIDERLRHQDAGLFSGQSLDLLPAETEIFAAASELFLASYDLLAISLIVSKVAAGVKYLVVQLVYGPGSRIATLSEAKCLREKLLTLAKELNLQITVLLASLKTVPAGAVGPLVEAQVVEAVLQKQPVRAEELKEAGIVLAGAALELCGKAKAGYGKKLARQCLQDGSAWTAWQKIIANQKPKEKIENNKPTRFNCQVKAAKAGRVREFCLPIISDTAKTLGAPQDLNSGIVFKVNLGERVKAGQVLFTLSAARANRLNLAVRAAKQLKLLKIS